MKKDIETIYNLHVDDLHTYALYLGFEKETIMDAIHDVFCKLAGEKEILNDVSNVKFYLFRSLKNRLFDIYKSKREHLNLIAVEPHNSPFNIHVTIEDKLIDIENQEIIKSQIEEMLNTLTDRQREVVYLRYIQEYDYQQISDLLNINIHSCRKLVSKAMTSLREKYGTLLIFLLLS